MKQVQQQIKKGIMVLLVLLLTVTIISAKDNLFNKKNNDEGGKLENVLMHKLKTVPTFANYFKTAKNPSLTGLLKSQRNAPKIDSMVSTAYDTSYQKVKNTYQYDANGFISNFLSEYFDDDSLVGGYNFNLDIRPDGQPTSSVIMDLHNGVWTNDEKGTYTYDPSGNQISYVSQKWDTTLTSWVNKYKHEYTYDANHNMLTDVSANWNSSSGTWKNSSKYEYNYDANKNVLSEKYSYWDNGSSVWKNQYMYEYTYDANNNKILELYKPWHSGTWVNRSKTEFTYDGNNNLISKNRYNWNSTSSIWENDNWTLYTYTNNRLTFQNEKRWDSGTSSWVDQSRTNSTYNSNGKYLSVLNEEYDGSVWQKESEYLFEYDSNDHVVSYIEKDSWNGSDFDENDKYNFRYNSMGICNGGNHETWFSGHWVSADAPWMMFMPKLFDLFYYGDTEISYLDELTWWFSYIPGYEYSVYYNGITDVKEKVTTPSKYTLAQNYPNPFNPSTKISYSLPNASHVSLKVYDILGNEITTLVNQKQSRGTYEVNFDASNLTSGIYFYQISTNNFSQVRKMMLLK